MKKSHLIAALAAAALAVSVLWVGLIDSRASAQQPGPVMQGPPIIAVIDVGFIIKHHARFKSATDEVRAEVQSADAAFKKQADDMNRRFEQLQQQYKPGTPEYKAEEEKLVAERSQLQGKIAISKRDFDDRMAKVYFAVYHEISDTARWYCSQKNIGVVLNYTSEPPKAENPQEVMRGLGSTVFVKNDNLTLDITGAVLAQISPQPAGPPTANINNRPTPPTGFQR